MNVKSEIFNPSERSQILQAAADLCAEQGYAETSVADVVERAGVPAKAFVDMFGNDVEECMLAAINAIVGEVMSSVAGSYSADRSELDSALLGIKALLELMAANPSFANLAYVVARQMASARVHETYEGGTGLLAAMLDRLREQSTGAQPPSKSARAALGGAEAVVRAEIAASRTEQLPRLLPDLAYAAAVSFLGQEQALRFASHARELLRGTPWE
jgi:AcrR family transcriptional regulator